MPHLSRATRTPWLVVAPAAIAAVFASWSVGFGLPFALRPDEELFVGRVVRMAVRGSLDPQFYFYPPVAYLLTAWLETALHALGLVALGGADRVDPTGAYAAARSLSVGAQVAAVASVFFAGRRAYGPAAGLTGALVLALSPLAVRQAHFATTDELQAAFAAGCLCAAAFAERPAGFALAGLLAELAAATKYPGGLVVLAPIALALYRPGRLRLAGSTIAGAALGFGLPLLLSGHWRLYAHFLRVQYLKAATPHAHEIGLFFYPTVALPFGLGLGAFALGVVGLGAALWQRRPMDAALAAVTAAFLLVTAPSTDVFFRYMLPALPALALLAGGALRLSRGRAPLLVAAVVAVLLAPSLYVVVETDRLLSQRDTRQLAAAWLLQRLPAGATVGQTDYFGEVLYGPADLRGNPLHPLYLSGDPLADSFQLGRFTRRLRPVPGPGGELTVLESEQPFQSPLPGPGGRATVAIFDPGSSAGAVYDPGDAFYLPYWGFGGVQRPGPAIRIVR